jgi:hypothetical protein
MDRRAFVRTHACGDAHTLDWMIILVDDLPIEVHGLVVFRPHPYFHFQDLGIAPRRNECHDEKGHDEIFIHGFVA